MDVSESMMEGRVGLPWVCCDWLRRDLLARPDFELYLTPLPVMFLFLNPTDLYVLYICYLNASNTCNARNNTSNPLGRSKRICKSSRSEIQIRCPRKQKRLDALSGYGICSRVNILSVHHVRPPDALNAVLTPSTFPISYSFQDLSFFFFGVDVSIHPFSYSKPNLRLETTPSKRELYSGCP